MDEIFNRMVCEHTPKVNRLIMDGLATTYMSKAEEYIDTVIKGAMKSLPADIEYHGAEVCTPKEEYAEITKLKNSKRTFDLARSDLYLVKYKFSFQGDPLPDKFVYLPLVGEAGIMFLKGSRFHITPILSDKVISPGFGSLFVRLLRYKIIFRRCYHTVMINDEKDTANVVWSDIYPKATDKKVPKSTKANSTIFHYLLGKYGLTRTFSKYCGFEPIVGTEQDVTEELYPRSDWIICESTGIKPKDFLGEYYKPNGLKLAIPRDQWSPLVKSFVIGFFYIVDHFPTRLRVSNINKTSVYRILLGHILFSGYYGENKLYEDICKHYDTIDNYVDGIVIEKLKETGYVIEDFYDLLALISGEFNKLLLNGNSNALSMYGKSLELLYYMLYDITSGIFNVSFKLSKPKGDRPLTLSNVKEIFNKNMRMRSIHDVTSGRKSVESVSYSGDHKYPKLTSKVTEQENLPDGRSGRKSRVSLGPDKHIDVSMIEGGSVLFLPKSTPTPMSKVNPFIHLDVRSATIIPNPELTDILKKTDLLFKKKVKRK